LTAIISGKVIRRGETSKALGGSELIAFRIASTINKSLLDKFNIIISRHQLYEDFILNSGNINIYLFQDMPGDRMYQNLFRNDYDKNFYKFIFVSNYQKQEFLKKFIIDEKKTCVIKNAIYPIDIVKKKFNGEVYLIYHTTPHRGLELLTVVFERILLEKTNVFLKIFSSFEIYGWMEKDREYSPLYNHLKNLKNVDYHGSVSNNQIREELLKSHIFAYPNIWPETSCLSAIEAMSAQNLLVLPDFAALKETGQISKFLYPYKSNLNDHMNIFYEKLKLAINFVESQADDYFLHINELKSFADIHHNWSIQKDNWNLLLNNILIENTLTLKFKKTNSPETFNL